MARAKPMKAQRADGAAAVARAARESGLAIEAECDVAGDCIDAMTARNLSMWLQYQLARWLVRTGRKGHWTIKATISKGVK